MCRLLSSMFRYYEQTLTKGRYCDVRNYSEYNELDMPCPSTCLFICYVHNNLIASLFCFFIRTLFGCYCLLVLVGSTWDQTIYLVHSQYMTPRIWQRFGLGFSNLTQTKLTPQLIWPKLVWELMKNYI